MGINIQQDQEGKQVECWMVMSVMEKRTTGEGDGDVGGRTQRRGDRAGLDEGRR